MKSKSITKLHFLYIRLVTHTTGFFEKLFFEPRLISELSKISPAMESVLIFDIGANRGQSIKLFRKVFKNSTIFAFEPSEKTFKNLENNCAMLDGVFLYKFGLGEKSGLMKFYESALDETSTLIYPNTNSSYFRIKKNLLLLTETKMFNQSEVRIETLDEFILEKSINIVDLLKIDVEGFELQVLRGARKTLSEKRYLNIQLERHEDNMRGSQSKEIDALLTTNGYTRVKSIKHSFGNFYEDIWSITDR
jgi:FkbM family methyltransferase